MQSAPSITFTKPRQDTHPPEMAHAPVFPTNPEGKSSNRIRATQGLHLERGQEGCQNEEDC